MKFKIRWSKSVLTKIDNQRDIIAEDAPNAAKKWVKNVKSKKIMIRDNPFIGRIVPEFGRANYREIIIGNYRLAYVVEGEYIDIVEFHSCRERIEED